jgi:hypothetical protein
MDDTKRQWVRSWLVEAQSDLRSARALVALAEPATATAIANAQAIYDFVLQQIPEAAHPSNNLKATS